MQTGRTCQRILLREAGYTIIGEPRWTGDGFYESAITDPDGNTVEITI